MHRVRIAWLSPAAAALGALVAILAGWRGVDLPAQLYRVGLFHRSGLTLWDSQWYGGHWTLSYSVIFPPVADVLGVHVTELLSAAGAAWGFDRLVVATSASEPTSVLCCSRSAPSCRSSSASCRSSSARRWGWPRWSR